MHRKSSAFRALSILILGCNGWNCQAHAAPATQGSAPAARPATSAQVEEALTLEKQGKLPEAIAAWRKVVQAEPQNGKAFAQLGLLESRAGDYPEAIRAYRKAEALHAKIPQLDLNLGLAYFKSGQFPEAAALFDRELKAQPGDQRLTLLVAMSQYGAHNYTAAIPYLKEGAASDPKNLPVRLALAHCYLWTKQFELTLAVYKEILEIDPDSAEADMIAGEALDEKGDNAGALEQFRAAEIANPKEPNVHFGLGYLLWVLKRYEEAIPEFKAELDNDPENYQDMIYLGDAYVQTNAYEQAQKVLEEAVKHEDPVPLIHLDLSIVYLEADRREDALKELAKTIAIEPDNVNAHFRLAKVYQVMGKKDEAKAEFAKARSLNKKTDDAVFNRIAAAQARPGRPAPVIKGEKPANPDAPAVPDSPKNSDAPKP
jgi:tetratricopeptide (TPR) repeat protein